MKRFVTLGDILQHEITLRGWQISEVAQRINCHRVTFSRYIKDERVFDLDVLDGLTSLLGYNPGHFYDFYNCWDDKGRQMRDLYKKVRDFIIRCLEYNLHSKVEENVKQILEKGQYSELFNIAQELKKRNQIDDALKFYDLVIEHETDRLSPALAQSYYERFLIVRNWDMDHALEASFKLGEYARNLEGEIRFEAYTKMLYLYWVLDKWDHLERFSNELVEIIEESNIGTNSVYYVDALLTLGVALRKKGKYSEAMEVIEKYAALPFEKHKIWAKGNGLVVEMEAGNPQKVFELYQFITDYPEESFQYLDIILENLVNNDWLDEAEAFLSEFSAHIEKLFTLDNPRDNKRKIVLCYYKSLLNYKKNRPWLDDLMVGIEIGKKLKFSSLLNWCYDLIVASKLIKGII